MKLHFTNSEHGRGILQLSTRNLPLWIFFILFFAGTNSFAQQGKATITGTVLDNNKNSLIGAILLLDNNNNVGTITDVNGHFTFKNVSVGKHVVKISYLGFETKEVTVDVSASENKLDIDMKEADNLSLTEVIVTTQKRSEAVMDVPISIAALDGKTLTALGIKDLDIMSNMTPGLNIQMQSTQRPSYAIRGITSEDIGAGSQPRVSVYHNGVPISRASGSALELYDMEGVEAVKGPQGTLFGRGAQSGAIHFISNKPKNYFETNINLGTGNYGQALAELAVNAPIIKNKLLLRVAGTYDYRNGFVKNTFGGTLNGRNTMAGKAYVKFLPTEKTTINLMYDYQKDDAPGTAFMVGYANAEGNKDIFSWKASFEQGRNLKTAKNIHELTATVDHEFNEGLSLASITSYRYYNAFEWWDGDGSAAPSLNFQQLDTVRQVYQEARLNFNRNRLKGFAGIAYWHENAKSDLWFAPNEQTAAWLLLGPQNMVDANGKPVYLPALPNQASLGSVAGMALPTDHEERQNTRAKTSSLDYFVDGTFQVTDRLSITAGVRFTQDFLNSGIMAANSKGSPSTLGYLTRNYPNMFFKPVTQRDTSANFSAVTGRFVVKYDISENSNLYGSYARGRRPQVLQYVSGVSGVLSDEIVSSFEVGMKTRLLSNLSIEMAGYTYDYSNFQTSRAAPTAPGQIAQWVATDGGMASAYGGEFTSKLAVTRNITFTANYSYIHARFKEKDKEGNSQRFSGNSFRLSPDHSFNLLLNAQFPITNSLVLFVMPSYAYKSRVVFDDANTKGLFQDPYGIANIIGGVRLPKQNMSFSLFANNLFDKKYIIDAGNTGLSFGIPSFVPGAPLTYGLKASFSFRK